ncbi:MAG: HD domain-containing protein [Planctomycetota bacterium]|nr:MAG: HD domain-containing protein [Planctomycetota bacterium]
MSPDERQRLADALAFAAEAHAHQRRKGSARDAPYVCHPMIVAGTVLEHGGSVDQAVAALLHDTLEDCAEVSREDLATRFGDEVARMVADCTDTLPGDTPAAKSPWETRKKRYLRHLEECPPDSLLVSACDKRHNLGSLVAEIRSEGLEVLRQFHSTPKQQVWYYRELCKRFRGRIPLRLQLELEGLADELESAIQAGQTSVWKPGEAPGEAPAD